jgi:hypothetical protein
MIISTLTRKAFDKILSSTSMSNLTSSFSVRILYFFFLCNCLTKTSNSVLNKNGKMCILVLFQVLEKKYFQLLPVQHDVGCGFVIDGI